MQNQIFIDKPSTYFNSEWRIAVPLRGKKSINLLSKSESFYHLCYAACAMNGSTIFSCALALKCLHVSLLFCLQGNMPIIRV